MARPTLSIRQIDRNRTYFAWQWEAPVVGPVSGHAVERADLNAILGELAMAIPIRLAGESDAALMARALTTGPFSRPETERELSARFASVLLPAALSSEIVEGYVRGGRVPILIRLEPAGLVAQVPWELFPLEVPDADGTLRPRRLIEIADIVQEVPGGVHGGRSRLPLAWEDDQSRTLFIIDPRTGLRAASPVLYPVGHDAFRARVAEIGHPRSRVDAEFTRKHLHLALSGVEPPRRLVFVGHVITVEDDPGATALVLSDPSEMFGVTATEDQFNRPLSALDLMQGTLNSHRRQLQLAETEGLHRSDLQWPAERGIRQSGADIWPMPSRVALVACNSGGDMRSSEPIGLAVALINAGAEYVTATRWTLPADRAFREFGGIDGYPLLETALALDDAHSTGDPVARVCAWQRTQLREWEGGDSPVAASPLLWAAFTTFVGSPRQVDEAEPISVNLTIEN
jgi:hypothetical protein